MTQVLRHRLIGAVFVLALAGIFLPMLFDGAGVSAIAPHQYEPIDVAAPRPEVAPMETDGKEWAFVDDAARQEATAGFGPEVDGVRTRLGQSLASDAVAGAGDSGRPAAAELPWVVQVATFEQRVNGVKLKDRLMADGFHAFVTDLRKADGQELVRVAVGPILDAAEARRMRDELASRYRVDAVLKRFGL